MAADVAAIIRDMSLRSGTGFPDVLVVDHAPKFTSTVFQAFVKSMGSSLIVDFKLAYHKNTNAKVERGSAGNRNHQRPLRGYANGRSSLLQASQFRLTKQ